MRLLAVLASFAAVIGLAVPAHGDPSGDDADFLAALIGLVPRGHRSPS